MHDTGKHGHGGYGAMKRPTGRIPLACRACVSRSESLSSRFIHRPDRREDGTRRWGAREIACCKLAVVCAAGVG
jgi:hypothetical protein